MTRDVLNYFTVLFDAWLRCGDGLQCLQRFDLHMRVGACVRTLTCPFLFPFGAPYTPPDLLILGGCGREQGGDPATTADPRPATLRGERSNKPPAACA